MAWKDNIRKKMSTYFLFTLYDTHKLVYFFCPHPPAVVVVVVVVFIFVVVVVVFVVVNIVFRLLRTSFVRVYSIIADCCRDEGTKMIL